MRRMMPTPELVRQHPRTVSLETGESGRCRCPVSITAAGEFELYALCCDGSMWRLYASANCWVQLPRIPGQTAPGESHGHGGEGGAA